MVFIFAQCSCQNFSTAAMASVKLLIFCRSKVCPSSSFLEMPAVTSKFDLSQRRERPIFTMSCGTILLLLMPEHEI